MSDTRVTHALLSPITTLLQNQRHSSSLFRHSLEHLRPLPVLSIFHQNTHELHGKPRNRTWSPGRPEVKLGWAGNWRGVCLGDKERSRGRRGGGLAGGGMGGKSAGGGCEYWQRALYPTIVYSWESGNPFPYPLCTFSARVFKYLQFTYFSRVVFSPLFSVLLMVFFMCFSIFRLHFAWVR